MITGLLADLAEHLDDSDRPTADLLRGRTRVVYLASRWRGRAAYAVFTGDEVPSVIVKVDTRSENKRRLRREWDALHTLAERPEMAGRVPTPLGLFDAGSELVLAQTGLPGVPMTVRVRRRLVNTPRSAARDLGVVREWLDLLHATHDGSDRHELAPDEVLARVEMACGDDVPASTLRTLTHVARDVGPLALPRRPQHGDLGPSNYLVHDGRVNVIDWEGGLAVASPLAELLIVLHQYGKVVPGPRGRPLGTVGNFERAFLSDHWLARTIARTWVEEVRRLGLPDEAAHYLLVATFADVATAAGTRDYSTHMTWRADFAWRLRRYLHEGRFHADAVR